MPDDHQDHVQRDAFSQHGPNLAGGVAVKQQHGDHDHCHGYGERQLEADDQDERGSDRQKRQKEGGHLLPVPFARYRCKGEAPEGKQGADADDRERKRQLREQEAVQRQPGHRGGKHDPGVKGRAVFPDMAEPVVDIGLVLGRHCGIRGSLLDHGGGEGRPAGGRQQPDHTGEDGHGNAPVLCHVHDSFHHALEHAPFPDDVLKRHDQHQADHEVYGHQVGACGKENASLPDRAYLIQCAEEGGSQAA